jgi:hypothetical protein|tara:strand:+ start:239 stop:466 length:228 start_codon:yes stop_codon:yes gene_type:complete
MQKLLAKFKATRALADARRLVNYSYKHPFAEAFLMGDDMALLNDAINMAREASRPAKDLKPTREQWVNLLAEVSQ